MKLFKKAKKGFTLVELVVVIAVIAILSAVSVGAYFGITESANQSRCDQEAKAFHTALILIANDPNDEGAKFDADNNLERNTDETVLEASIENQLGYKVDVVDTADGDVATGFDAEVAFDTAGNMIYGVVGKTTTLNIKTGTAA